MKKEVFTVLGAGGFVGQALTQWLRHRGHDVHTPERQLSPNELVTKLSGHVVYCIGLTSDFRRRPWDTVDAHVCMLRHVLSHGEFSSFTYLSSTRVYLGGQAGNEGAALTVQPELADQLYNVSKLLGESMCHTAHSAERPVRVVRLSNVVGGDLSSENFIYTLLREALTRGVIQLNSSLDSSKDYIAISDVVRMIERIAVAGQARCYNLASGRQITNAEIVEAITRLTGARVIVADNSPQIVFPQIDIGRLKSEFNFTPSSPIESLEEIVALLKQNIQRSNS
ncbi:MAG: sugar nucleotide oxidoreductase/epimerase [Thermosynechococcus sp.]|uniref:NAD-dependent epimerase/dehydratase family protein n=1 Tax=Thermosynechococcus sp. TaxID=2814275 RepID=UPI0021FB36C9|nr:NAD(P)-dependent oxidoreductase [Thermosynechococcus sp.]BCX12100.1 MAG: sugar nucleotide oxidoreductase/epimerase [Thermosynechococcus sp.]